MRRWLWLPLLLVPGCAAFQSPKEDPKPLASLERVRTDPKGVCASIADLSGEAWSAKQREPTMTVGDKLLSSTVQACLRALPPAGGEEERAAVDVTLVFPQLDERWRPDYWHIEVIGEGGLVVHAGSLSASKIEDGVCVLDVCNKEGHATVHIPEPWRAERYRIRLTHVPTRKRVELVVTLS